MFPASSALRPQPGAPQFPSLSNAGDRDRVFSITYTRSARHNFRYHPYSLRSAHVSAKTPGGRIGPSTPIFSIDSASLPTSTDSISYANVPSNPFRILLFHKSGG